MPADVCISHLADHPEAVPVLKQWFETEWADYYGPGGSADAERDLIAYSRREKLPVGLVAFCADELCGIAVLKPQSLRTHQHLCPWAAAGLVHPSFRGRGIGEKLLNALEGVARDLGYATIYCGTGTATSLLERNGWQFMERASCDGETVSVYRKDVPVRAFGLIVKGR